MEALPSARDLIDWMISARLAVEIPEESEDAEVTPEVRESFVRCGSADFVETVGVERIFEHHLDSGRSIDQVDDESIALAMWSFLYLDEPVALDSEDHDFALHRRVTEGQMECFQDAAREDPRYAALSPEHGRLAWWVAGLHTSRDYYDVPIEVSLCVFSVRGATEAHLDGIAHYWTYEDDNSPSGREAMGQVYALVDELDEMYSTYVDDCVDPSN